LYRIPRLLTVSSADVSSRPHTFSLLCSTRRYIISAWASTCKSVWAPILTGPRLGGVTYLVRRLSNSSGCEDGLCLVSSRSALMLVDATLPPARNCPDRSAPAPGCSYSPVCQDALYPAPSRSALMLVDASLPPAPSSLTAQYF